jgi:hypothetical protein
VFSYHRRARPSSRPIEHAHRHSTLTATPSRPATRSNSLSQSSGSNRLSARGAIFVSRRSRKRLRAAAGLRSSIPTRACPSEAWGQPVHQRRLDRQPETARGYDQHGRQEPAPAKAGGRCMDNIFVERLWRSLKYEEVYLSAEMPSGGRQGDGTIVVAAD